ncbi:RNA polymerase I associated factor, A49-like protein [Exidia glandulosa HHB12029]|uniref:RNA polymerase I associated factor, A49-like protein n=1 Tax=Exidia glandulosa HHB12029 TaxID=1314781 RepID=A0A165ZMA5_EXIGL|nr:RNA polymerase I associated factor, A49-like protein [Exidia glandulosa HHB12029]
MSTSTASKKRKRSPSPAGLKVKSSDLETNLGPRLASFPAIEPAEETPFGVYGSTGDGELLAGETTRVEFEGREHPGSSQYLVALYDKRTHSLRVRRAPLHVLDRRVKRLKSLATAAVTGADAGFQQARVELGTAFGTKKAQAAIRAAARNKVDVGAMRGVADHLQARIEVQTKALPTKEEAVHIAEEGRLVPPFDLNATKPEDAYPLNGMIPDAEFSALNASVKKLQDAKTPRERHMLLPHRPVGWLTYMLDSLFAAPHLNKVSLKITWYVAALLAFRRVAQGAKGAKDRAALYEALPGLPKVVVDGMAARFMETGRDGQLQLTPAMETKHSTWTLALMLRADGSSADTALVAQTMNNAPVPKVQMWFRSLGCQIGAPPTGRKVAEGATDVKWATLKVPLEFPKIRAKPNQRR